ncbi:serine threonine- kinase PRP4 -like protein [Labeo rohita]|uniref:Serine threonine-kinase PRP4-like protein n=1 Tax=Labeo rohita TaxID=84645 RepID=A0A498MDD6_LABRO|nr:serine threonine- kinase PRP4 -like protein [Labeo rohita]
MHIGSMPPLILQYGYYFVCWTLALSPFDEAHCPLLQVMLFVRAVWNENGKEMEGTIPDAWVNVAKKTLRWPKTRAKYCFDNHVAPKEDWETFPLLKVKFTSGSDLSETTAEGEDKEERKGDASPMIPVFPTPPIKKSKNVGRDRSNSDCRILIVDQDVSAAPQYFYFRMVHPGLRAATGLLVVHPGLRAATGQLVIRPGPGPGLGLCAGTVQVVVYPGPRLWKAGPQMVNVIGFITQ